MMLVHGRTIASTVAVLAQERADSADDDKHTNVSWRAPMFGRECASSAFDHDWTRDLTSVIGLRSPSAS